MGKIFFLSGEFSGECPYCKIQTHFRLVSNHNSTKGKIYRTIECPCGEITLLETDPYNSVLHIYPKQKAPLLSEYLPEHIRYNLNEAWICYNNEIYNSCAVMCRKIIEAIVKEKGGVGSNLEKKIDSLPDTVIPADLKSVAHSIRIVGNNGAHLDILDIENVSEEDAKESLDFVDMFNHYIYILPKRAMKKNNPANT